MKLQKRLHILGERVLYGGGGGQDTIPAGSRNDLKTRPKMTSASIWPTSAPRSTFQREFLLAKPQNYPRFGGGGGAQ